MHPRIHALVAALALPTALLSAADAPADKSAYTLFNRTPASQLRELSTDRPDLTESAYTVDAGWWQIESDLVAYTKDHDKSAGSDIKASALSLTTLNIKLGLTHNIDLQTVLEPWTRVKVDDRINSVRGSLSGFGDITSRLKINFWGNDGGKTAFALMPFVKWPTAREGFGNDSVEGGIIAPLAVELPAGWGMGIMTEVDIIRNGADDGYTADWINSITFSHDISGNLGGYVELFTQLTDGPDIVSFDCGLTYGIGDHVQLDCGANIGLTKVTEDITVFTGIAVRF